jgi:UDPglucose 6-dehydrogenase
LWVGKQLEETMRITVYGLWHLGCVTAACLAEAGYAVTGLDPDEARIADLCEGRPPLHEPGLTDLLAQMVEEGRLRFSAKPADALRETDVLWVTFDTPVNDSDEANVNFVRQRLANIADVVRADTLVLISSQVPVGFTRELEEAWSSRGCRFAYSPENLRLGRALESFRRPQRVVVGVREMANRPPLAALFAPFCDRIEWMSVESAEMTKHALNAFLATSVTFANELARLCETVGADAKEVERGLKSDVRIGERAYLSPGSAFAGGTLARDVRFLMERGQRDDVAVPLLQGVWSSNEVHKDWLRHQVQTLLAKNGGAVVAVLGLTYKPGTDTLRRSASVELCSWLHRQGFRVRAHDPAVTALPAELGLALELCASPLEALQGADVAVIATEWPVYRELCSADISGRMHCPLVVDPNHFLADVLGRDPRIRYVVTGRAA